MEKTGFPGQQTGERILYLARPHRLIMYIEFFKVFILGTVALIAIESITLFLQLSLLSMLGLIVLALLMFLGILFIYHTYSGSEAYITDRRVVRFVPTLPFGRHMRSIFWEEVAKTKTLRKNYFLENLLGVGSVQIHPKSNAEKDNINIDYLSFYEDLANYIDKILYIYRSKPEGLGELREFVAKPRGQRGSPFSVKADG